MEKTWSRKQGTERNRTFNKHDQENKEQNEKNMIKNTRNGMEQNL